MKIFKKDLMIKRLTAEGKADQITEEIIAIMNNLDGQPATSNSWHRQVKDEPVLSCMGKDGKAYDVFEGDCI